MTRARSSEFEPRVVERHFDSARALLNAIGGRDLREFPIGSDTVFRGVGRASYSLTPSLLRRSAWRHFVGVNRVSGLHTPRRHIVLAELHIVEAFTQLADSHGLSVPAFHTDEAMVHVRSLPSPSLKKRLDDLTDVQLLSLPHRAHISNLTLAQHYGCPTRLLDWSFKPLVAAYFAAKYACCDLRAGVERSELRTKSTPSEPRLAIWALRADDLHEWQGRDRTAYEIEVVRAPQAGNVNLAAQAGVFTLDRLGLPNRPLETRILELQRRILIREPIDIAYWRQRDLLCKLTLPTKHAPELLERLSNLGVSAASVFPGYLGVVERLREQAFYLRNLYVNQGEEWMKTSRGRLAP